VATGRRQGTSIWNKFGYNTDIDNTAQELIASWGGAFQFITTGETLDIVSTSTDDVTRMGARCHGLVIYGVDSELGYSHRSCDAHWYNPNHHNIIMVRNQ
jgi:predicted SpoU family rRNA methylase